MNEPAFDFEELKRRAYAAGYVEGRRQTEAEMLAFVEHMQGPIDRFAVDVTEIIQSDPETARPDPVALCDEMRQLCWESLVEAFGVPTRLLAEAGITAPQPPAP